MHIYASICVDMYVYLYIYFNIDYPPPLVLMKTLMDNKSRS